MIYNKCKRDNAKKEKEKTKQSKQEYVIGLGTRKYRFLFVSFYSLIYSLEDLFLFMYVFLCVYAHVFAGVHKG